MGPFLKPVFGTSLTLTLRFLLEAEFEAQFWGPKAAPKRGPKTIENAEKKRQTCRPKIGAGRTPEQPAKATLMLHKLCSAPTQGLLLAASIC